MDGLIVYSVTTILLIFVPLVGTGFFKNTGDDNVGKETPTVPYVQHFTCPKAKWHMLNNAVQLSLNMPGDTGTPVGANVISDDCHMARVAYKWNTLSPAPYIFTPQAYWKTDTDDWVVSNGGIYSCQGGVAGGLVDCTDPESIFTDPVLSANKDKHWGDWCRTSCECNEDCSAYQWGLPEQDWYTSSAAYICYHYYRDNAPSGNAAWNIDACPVNITTFFRRTSDLTSSYRWKDVDMTMQSGYSSGNSLV